MGRLAALPGSRTTWGFAHGVSGTEFAERARDQAVRFGAAILLTRAGVRADSSTGNGIVYLEDGTRITARTSVCATGVAYRRLDELPDEARFNGGPLLTRRRAFSYAQNLRKRVQPGPKS